MIEQALRAELRRDSLLERLALARPSLLALIAPAGFGKSTLTRQYLFGKSGVGVVDCSGVSSDLDLARRLMPALAAESPDRTTLLTQREMLLGDGGTSVAERVRLALDAWRMRPTDATTIVFENAEYIANNSSARDLFSALLAQRPGERSIVICSRESLRLHLTRFAPPHEIIILRASDLAFDRNEIREIFKHSDCDDATLDRVLALSQGWPIAILLVKRFATEGRMEHLLDRLNDVTLDELHDYLVDEVLASLSANMIEALFAAASIPKARPAEIAIALDDPAVAEAIDEFAKESPFIVRTQEDTLSVHPLLASLLLEHRKEKCDEILRIVARAHIKNESFIRAAELHLARGDQMSAAEALGRHEVIRDPNPSMRYASVLAALDRNLVRRYPRLWGVTALLRNFCVNASDLLDEADAMWRMLPPETPPMERFYIWVFRALSMTYVGMFDEAYAVVSDFAKKAAVGDEPRTQLEAYIFYIRGLVLARMGRLSEAERELTAALPIAQAMEVMASGALVALGADVARVRGEVALERQFLDRALDHARKSVQANFVAFDLAESVVGAWLSGWDEIAARSALELDRLVERAGARGFAYLAAAARGRDAEPREADMLKFVAMGRLIACANAFETEAAARLARQALGAAEQYHSPFVACLACIAVALFEAENFSTLMGRARDYAAQCDSPKLHAAVNAITERKPPYGMLDVFVDKLSRQRVRRALPLEVELLTGEVHCEGETVQLSGRELQLLIALAVRREVVPRVRLAEMLWGDQDEYAARNALSVTLHRLRGHLGNDAVVVREGDGYRLHDEAWVDMWEIERLVATVRSRGAIGDPERPALRDAYARLCAPMPARMQSWEWFEPMIRHIGEIRLEIAMRLASDALSRDSAEDALTLAHEMIAYDPCDEPAREIAIRAYIQMGDRAAAMRHYRQYRETLMTELQCEPSNALRDLVGKSS